MTGASSMTADRQTSLRMADHLAFALAGARIMPEGFGAVKGRSAVPQDASLAEGRAPSSHDYLPGSVGTRYVLQ